MPEFTGHRDLRQYLGILWRWKALFLAFVIAVPVGAYMLERGKPNIYRSTALVGINQATVDTSLLTGTGGSFSTSNVLAIADLIATTPVSDLAARLLHPPANPSNIAGEVSASGDPTTNFITISAEDRSPARAAAIANAFAQAISSNRQMAAIAQLDSAINGIVAQLKTLSPTGTATRPALEQQLSQLRAARSTQGSDAAILQSATPSATPVGPQVRRTVELALVIGLLLGFGAVVLAENADRRLRSPEDLEGLTAVPLLATIPPGAFSKRLDTGPEHDEAFNMLRNSLTYYNLDRPLDSVVVTSPGEKDGKTTVAIRLALAAARAHQTVVLVDADLRRAQVGARLGVALGTGLSDVLACQLPLSDALIDYPLDDAGTGRLIILPAGEPPTNPSALMSSVEMRAVLRQLESRSDLVIVDTPAALAVSDSLALMGNVSGVILVARMNQSSRQPIWRLQRMIKTAHGQLLGLVATGVTASVSYEGYTPKAYTANGDGRPRVAKGDGRRGARRRSPKPEATPAPSPEPSRTPTAAPSSAQSPSVVDRLGELIDGLDH